MGRDVTLAEAQRLIVEAETKIKGVLENLHNATGLHIESVDLETHNYTIKFMEDTFNVSSVHIGCIIPTRA